jgi:hypothetical protein
MLSPKTTPYADIRMEDVKSIDELKEITNEEAEKIRQDIVSLCDLMAEIMIEESKNERHERKKSECN